LGLDGIEISACLESGHINFHQIKSRKTRPATDEIRTAPVTKRSVGTELLRRNEPVSTFRRHFDAPPPLFRRLNKKIIQHFFQAGSPFSSLKHP
jgi:hypothetical protein